MNDVKVFHVLIIDLNGEDDYPRGAKMNVSTREIFDVEGIESHAEKLQFLWGKKVLMRNSMMLEIDSKGMAYLTNRSL